MNNEKYEEDHLTEYMANKTLVLATLGSILSDKSHRKRCRSIRRKSRICQLHSQCTERRRASLLFGLNQNDLSDNFGTQTLFPHPFPGSTCPWDNLHTRAYRADHPNRSTFLKRNRHTRVMSCGLPFLIHVSHVRKSDSGQNEFHHHLDLVKHWQKNHVDTLDTR